MRAAGIVRTDIAQRMSLVLSLLAAFLWFGEPANALRIAAVGGAGGAIERLTVFRDVHWFRPPLEVGSVTSQTASHVPPGTVWLLGDNSVDSRDSRHFRDLPASTFVGRPRAVLGPWPYQRWLSR